MEGNLSPRFEATNSLLMKRPVGCAYFRPFGAVNSTVELDMVTEVGVKIRVDQNSSSDLALAQEPNKRSTSEHIYPDSTHSPLRKRELGLSIRTNPNLDDWAVCGEESPRNGSRDTKHRVAPASVAFGSADG